MTDVGETWVYACRVGELPNGEGLRVQLPGGGKKDAVALFAYNGEFFALEDRCCHADKSLHGGDIEDIGQCVIGESGEVGASGVCVQCPRHQRKFAGGLYFNLETGHACTPEYTKKFAKLSRHHVDVHAVLVHRGSVYVSSRPRSSAAKKRVPRPESWGRQDDVQSTLVRDSPPEKRPRQDPLCNFWHCELRGKELVNHDTFVFHLRHPEGAQLPQAPEASVWHVTLRAHVSGVPIERDYTPLSNWQEWRDERRLRLLIKIYPNGAMTQHLASLSLGDTVSVSAPLVTLSVPALLPASTTVPAHVILFAAGTGVMPMLQVLREVLQANSNSHHVTLMYSNREYRDLLCWEELLRIGKEAKRVLEPEPSRFKIWLAFSQQDPCTVWSEHEQDDILAGIVKRRFDAMVISDALSAARGEPVVVVSSGPDGFFESMKKMLPESVQQEAIFVNLDE